MFGTLHCKDCGKVLVVDFENDVAGLDSEDGEWRWYHGNGLTCSLLFTVESDAITFTPHSIEP